MDREGQQRDSPLHKFFSQAASNGKVYNEVSNSVDNDHFITKWAIDVAGAAKQRRKETSAFTSCTLLAARTR